MKRWVENAFVVLFWIFVGVLCAGLTFGFYYLIFVLAKKVFFGQNKGEIYEFIRTKADHIRRLLQKERGQMEK